MGKKRRNKKKQSKPQSSPPQCLVSRQDVLDELLALEAVYAEDITIIREQGWFSLIIIPNPSDPESNLVFVTLDVHYTENYPDQCPKLEFTTSVGISESQCAELLEELNQAAVELSKLKDVFLFTLIDHCQESLRQWNEAIQAEHMAEFDAALKSIKHQDPSFAFSQLQQGTTAHGLFGEPVPLNPRLKPKARQQLQETHHIKTQDLSLQLSIKDRTPAVLSKQQTTRDLEDSRLGTGVSTSMLSLVASMMEKIGPLPTAISTYLGLAQTETGEQIESSVFRTEMLIGHLLRLLTSGKTGSFQKEMLPFLCTELHEKGILPKWLHWILIHKPTVFEKIFNKIFEKEIEVARNTETNTSQSVQLLEFWTSPIEGTTPKDRITTSRYHTDFEEIRIFGKGGFGLVVSAINRLDGRQYAIKKIKLVATSIHAYTKIIREVSTLARLQHPNVVRYFQAWLEPSSELDELQSEDSMNLDDFLQTDGSDSEHDAEFASKETGTTNFSIQHTILKQNQTKLPVLQEGSLSSESPVQTPQIVFDSGSGFRSQDLPSKGGGSKEKEVRHQILYIQMEACPRTLQQILDSRTPLEEEEKWEILRQILRGLAYIHSLRTIHRDLKPANIFYSSTGEIKLGDFGLAKFATNESMKDGIEGTAGGGGGGGPNTPSRQMHSTETSGVCGTSFYIAPEIENHWPSYDSQVDMYSLGIVVFELWHPFSTLMERILTLKDLKEKSQFPSDWKQRNPQIAHLVSWLLTSIPSRRPTAKELLRSEFLPARVGDEQVQDLIRSLENDSETYDRVIDGVFRSAQASSRSGGDPVLAGTPVLQSRTQLEFQDQLLSSIKEVLGRHGVAQMTSQDTGLCYSSLPSNAVRVLSNSGILHSLKYDMRYPFVEWILEEYEKTDSGNWSRTSEFSIENLRRFDVDWICREGQGSNLVRKHLQLDVDFVTAMLPSITETILNDSVMLHKLLAEQLLSEAELIKIISEIANCFRFSEQDSTIEIRLTHSSLLHHCLEDIRLDQSILTQAINLLTMTGRFSPVGPTRVENWTPIQTALEGLGLSSSQLRNLKRFMTRFSGESELIVPQLRSALSNGGNKSINASTMLALEEIQTLVQLLQKWGLFGEQVVIDPIMIPESDYYSGIYFQVHLIHPQKRTGKLLSIGGRYEKLLKSLWKSRTKLMGSSPNYGLIGTTMNLSPFIKQKLESLSQSLTWRSSSDVLVCSKGGGASSLETRMELISSLWSQGIKAEMLHRVNPTMTAQYDYATLTGMRILVIIDDQILSSCKTVKIKNLDRKQEDDVPYQEVPQFILNILQTRTSMTKLS